MKICNPLLKGKRLTFLLLLTLITSQAMASFLPVKKAFPYTINVTPKNILVVKWRMNQGYYLYKSKFTITQDGEKLLTGFVDKPNLIKDEYFGDTYIFRNNVTIYSQLKSLAPVEITYQGCAESLLCYPLETIYLIDHK